VPQGDVSLRPYERGHPNNRHGTMTTERYNPNNKGWGIALFIIALAIAANVTAYSIHKATYLKPDAPKAAAH
jgi:hypothetical protein